MLRKDGVILNVANVLLEKVVNDTYVNKVRQSRFEGMDKRVFREKLGVSDELCHGYV